MPKQKSRQPVRVMYSFPNRIGAGRICWTAWQQVAGLVGAGAEVSVVTASAVREPVGVKDLVGTLSRGFLRFPCRLIGSRRASILHDWIASRWLDRNAARIDIVHAWPLGALKTISVARKHGIPILLERPNTHTEFAYRAVSEECRQIGLELPDGFEHKFDGRVLDRETAEYNDCDFLLCPSDFVKETFVKRNYQARKLLRHQYGYDSSRIRPGRQDARSRGGLVVIYAGLCTPRKGLHYALQAWLASEAGRNGRFLICGDFVPGYRQLLSDILAQPGIEVLGHRTDLPQLMQEADLFILPTVEEGSALVTYEARGSGCVLVVSEASGAVCEHMVDGLVHPVKDAKALAASLDLLDENRELLATLRANSIAALDHLTWEAAGRRLLGLYREVLAERRAAATA